MSVSSQYWEQFCKSTGIKAFLFLYNARTKPEKLLWLLTLIVFTCITVYEVFDTVGTYVSAPTITKVQMMDNLTHQIDSLSMCFKRALAKMRGSELAKTQPAVILKQLNLSHIERLLGKSKLNESTKVLVNDIYVMDLLYLSSVMLSQLMRMELSFDDRSSLLDVSFMGNSKSIHRAGETAKLTYQFYQQYNILPHEIIMPIGSLTWALMNLLVTKTTLGEERKMETAEQISWFGIKPWGTSGSNDQICLQFGPALLNFASIDDDLAISFEEESIFPIIGTHRNNHIYIFLDGDPVQTPEYQNVIRAQENYNTHVTVQISGVFKPTGSCTQVTRAECLINCRAAYIRQFCGCEPLFAIFVPKDTTDPQLNSCVQPTSEFLVPNDNTSVECKSLQHLTRQYCRLNCEKPCQKHIYTSMIEKEPIDRVAFPNQTVRVVLEFDCFMYPIYEQILQMSGRTLLAQLGGNLSLWLGASFLVLLHMGIYMTQVAIKFFQPQNLNPRDPGVA